MKCSTWTCTAGARPTRWAWWGPKAPSRSPSRRTMTRMGCWASRRHVSCGESVRCESRVTTTSHVNRGSWGDSKFTALAFQKNLDFSAPFHGLLFSWIYVFIFCPFRRRWIETDESKNQKEIARFEVKRERGSFGNVTVFWNATGISGDFSNNDILPSEGMLEFAGGETSKFIEIESLPDNVSRELLEQLKARQLNSNTTERTLFGGELPTPRKYVLDVVQLSESRFYRFWIFEHTDNCRRWFSARKALWLTFSLPSSKSTSSQPFKEKCISVVARIVSLIIFHLSMLWKAKFFILCDEIFVLRLQEKFEIDHS